MTSSHAKRSSEQAPLLASTAGNARSGAVRDTSNGQASQSYGATQVARTGRRRPSQASSYSSYGTLGAEGDAESRILLTRDEEPTSPRAAHARNVSTSSELVGPPTPLPWRQIFVICIMRLSEPMAFLCIVPFIPQMLQDNLPGVSKEEIGFYAGFVESIFALVQFATVFLWGRASDRIGRKPVLLLGLAGVFLSMNAFGFAKTLPQMILARSIAGLMGGNIGVLKSVIGELTDESNQARAFSYLPLCFGVGSMIGPFLGGTLSDPAEHFAIFRNSAFLKEYPYWLPCFAASLFAFFGALTGFFFLEETLPGKSHIKNTDPEHAEIAEPPTIATEAPPLRQLLTTPVVRALANATMINFVNVCYIAVLPLFAYTPLDSGGLSLSKQEIGTYLGANGIMTIVVQLAIFPTLERRLGGPLPTLRFCLTLLPFVFVCFALAHFTGKMYGKTAIWLSLSVLLVCRGASSLMVVASNLCINNVIESRLALGAINGLSQMLTCLSRAAAPIFANSAFALSISRYRYVFDGQLVWAAFFAIALLTWYTSARMEVPRRAAWRKT